MSRKASDGMVHARTVLETVLQLQRQGTEPSMRQLEQSEPDLAEYLLESLSDLHQRLGALGGSPGRTRRVYRRMELMTLICIQALRKGHYELWKGETDVCTRAGTDDAPARQPDIRP
jgi:hypothetical protein